LPKSRLDFWQPKLEANARRDKTRCEDLEQLGWKVLTIWECEIKDHVSLKAKIASFLSDEIN